MNKLVLPNGLTVIYKQSSSNALAIQAMVKVGSNTEKNGQRGIAHMVEHLVFEGTPKSPNGNDVARAIERVGGEFNAYTSNHRTNYYIKPLGKHGKLAINVIGDILQNALMLQKDFIREREVVCKEIDMFQDDPKSFQWLHLEKMLFVKNAAKYPSCGIKKELMKLSRDDVYKFYKENYHPKNVVIVIVGNLPQWKKLIKEEFGNWKARKPTKRPMVNEPLKKRTLKKKMTKPYENNYMLIGFVAAKRGSKDSYALDVIQAILGKGQSGNLFHELRGKRGLVYDVAVEYGSDLDFGYFVVYASCSKKHAAEVRKVVSLELKKLETCSLTEIKDAKTFLEGDYLMDVEDVQKQAEQLLFWYDIGDEKLFKKYIRNIKAVSAADIKRVVKKYFAYPATIELVGKGK